MVLYVTVSEKRFHLRSALLEKKLFQVTGPTLFCLEV